MEQILPGGVVDKLTSHNVYSCYQRRFRFFALGKRMTNWDKDDDKDQTDKDGDYVSKDNPYEIPDMIDGYEKRFGFSRDEISRVIDSCREKVGAPFPREQVEECVEKNLKIKAALRKSK